jgi:hypothetical protein
VNKVVLRALTLLAIVSLVLGRERLARAAETDETDESVHELTRLHLTVRGLADDAKDRRYNTAIASGMFSVVAVGAGVALSVAPGDSSSDVRHAAGGAALGLGIDAGALAIAMRFFYEDPHETLRATVEQETGRGLSSAATIEAIDLEWKASAERERTRRFVAGGIVVAAGAVVGASGALVPELTHGGGGGTSYVGGLLMGAGSVMVVLGAELLFLPSPIETSYQTRSLGAARAGGGLGSRVRVGGGVLPGGGAMQLGLSF